VEREADDDGFGGGEEIDEENAIDGGIGDDAGDSVDEFGLGCEFDCAIALIESGAEGF